MAATTPDVRCDTLLIVGLGLIGGSLAAALRGTGFCRRLLAWDRDATALDAAMAAGLIDDRPADLEVTAAQADLVVIAVPTLAVGEVLERLHDAGEPVLTDVASVKGSVLADARRVFGGLPARLVPGHPIAGRERSGVGAADPELFRQHRVILTPHADTDRDALALVESMWRSCGAELVRMAPDHHDRVLAFTSHLPHLLAFALVEALAREDSSEEIFRFAAGGFRDFTRIASSDPVMWRDIVLANREAVLASLDHFGATIDGLRAQIAAGDGGAIHESFAEARAARNRYLGWLDRGREE